jgi:hypothetical protein
MVEQKHDNEAEQKARAEESRQEAEQLVKLQRHGVLDPSLFTGLLSVYLLFLYTILAFGVIAFYSGHLITLKIVFFTFIPLILIVPIGVFWYLRTLFPRKPSENVAPGKKSLPDRIMQSFVGIGNSRVFRLLNFALCIYTIADAIRAFPQHPRFSLAVVALDTAFFSALMTLLVVSTFQRKLSGAMDGHLDITKMLFDIVAYTYDVAERSRKFIADTEASHQEAHESIVGALKAIDHTTRVMANTTDKPTPQIDAPSPEVANREGDEEIDNG